MEFKELNILPSIMKALDEQGYTTPTDIQCQAIPKILEGRDLLGCAQTGTGKTAAFAVPTLQILDQLDFSKGKRKIRALIVTPTRELAVQIHESYCNYGKHTQLKSAVIFGGVSQKPQEAELRKGVDILVATPGRLNDLINQGIVDIGSIKIFILDEADRMLDMGFLNDVKKIIAKIPKQRQTLLFSATMPADIAKMANSILINPAKVSITPVSSTVDAIEQSVYFVDRGNKKDLLIHLLADKKITTALVFTKTKHRADSIVKHLLRANITAQAIHGNKSQNARQLALNNFKTGKIRVLVATDIAARGIDIDQLSHVINFELPDVPETYVHRIGRTGRAGMNGIAISFCDFDEKPLLADIVKLIGKRVPQVDDHPYPLMNNFPSEKETKPRQSRPRTSQGSTNASRDSSSRTGKSPASARDFSAKGGRSTASSRGSRTRNNNSTKRYR